MTEAEAKIAPRTPQPGRRGTGLSLPRIAPGSLVTLTLSLWLVAAVACTVAWALAGTNGHWPLWVWLAGAPIAGLAALQLGRLVGPGRGRWAAAHAGLALIASAVLTLVWALTGTGGWLGWSLLGIGVAFVVHALVAFADRLPPQPRERVLSARVDELEKTRRGAIDFQAAEFRRLERDLHDGTQSRLVAVAMLLGRAEERIDGSSDAGRLVHQAHEEVGTAISELRDLVRGLAPPLLAERGLPSAIDGLLMRSPIEVDVDCRIEEELSPAVQEAAYFFVAEGITNAIKHAPGASARVRLVTARGTLVAEVDDDGQGGADPAGLGLVGLRHRIEALDGSFTVASVDGVGTTLRTELPCG